MAVSRPDAEVTIHPRLRERLADTLMTRTIEFQVLRLCAVASLHEALRHLDDLDTDSDTSPAIDLMAECRAIIAVLSRFSDDCLPSGAELADVAAHLNGVSNALMAAAARLDAQGVAAPETEPGISRHTATRSCGREP